MSSYYFIGDSLTGPIRASTGTFTGNVTVGGTLGVTGQTTLGSLTVAVPLKTSGGTTVANLDVAGTAVPAVGNPTTYYIIDDWDTDQVATNYTQNGNVVINAFNTVSQPLVDNSTLGVAYVNTSSTTAGGYVSRPGTQIIKSSTFGYQWRVRFYLPTLSTGTNRYTAFIGGCVFTGTANNTLTGALGGAYIKYSDNTNSGNWILGSAVASTNTTANSSVAAATGWHNLTISLANGTYTYVLDGVTLGTVVDSNLATTPTINQVSANGGICIVPDGTNFTTNRVVMIDRSDFYITGLSR